MGACAGGYPVQLPCAKVAMPVSDVDHAVILHRLAPAVLWRAVADLQAPRPKTEVWQWRTAKASAAVWLATRSACRYTSALGYDHLWFLERIGWPSVARYVLRKRWVTRPEERKVLRRALEFFPWE